MKVLHLSMTWAVACIALQLSAQESPPVTPVKALKDHTQRGTLSDQRQIVRGDSGKWSDAAALQHAPPLDRKPKDLPLDEWVDQLTEEKSTPATTATEDNWLLFRTRQLDDNDRVWVEKIERQGNEFTIVLNEAIWQGRYQKTFTYYEVTAVNLGQLPPDSYTVKWQIQPLTFKQMEKPKQPNRDAKDNWPTDDQPAVGAKPVVLKTAFAVR